VVAEVELLVVEVALEDIENLLDQHQVVIQYHQEAQLQLQL
jgi:hypothetical protein